jgi:hypothetical protein
VTEVHHPLFARVFDRPSERGERMGQAEHRQQTLAGLSGRVVELGAGNRKVEGSNPFSRFVRRPPSGGALCVLGLGLDPLLIAARGGICADLCSISAPHKSAEMVLLGVV